MPSREITERIADLHRMRVTTFAELRGAGLSRHRIAEQVRLGVIVRVRRGVYVVGDVPAEVMAAVRIGGRVACLTLLRMLGVFVLEHPGLHVHVPADLSRSRRRRPREARLHWGPCSSAGLAHAVSLADAVRQAIRCQPPRAAIATLDSVLHERVLNLEQIAAIFRELPERFQSLLALVDGTAESGPETFVRLILRALGARYETQVAITGVGRVDFVVEGWLIIECDSYEFHQGWNKQVDDRARDLAAARAGYVTIRLLASDVFDRPDAVRESIAGVIAALGARGAAARSAQLRKSGV